MRLSDFILMSEDEKKFTVLHRGVLIAKRDHADRKIFLFQLERYYVEAYCNPESKEIEEYQVFEDVSLLTPYLEAIPIEHLLN
jgi:hypothetical protein